MVRADSVLHQQGHCLSVCLYSSQQTEGLGLPWDVWPAEFVYFTSGSSDRRSLQVYHAATEPRLRQCAAFTNTEIYDIQYCSYGLTWHDMKDIQNIPEEIGGKVSWQERPVCNERLLKEATIRAEPWGSETETEGVQQTPLIQCSMSDSECTTRHVISTSWFTSSLWFADGIRFQTCPD